jgi:hypothetical protein
MLLGNNQGKLFQEKIQRRNSFSLDSVGASEMTGLGKHANEATFWMVFLEAWRCTGREEVHEPHSLRGEETFSNWMQRDGNGGIGIVGSGGGGGG